MSVIKLSRSTVGTRLATAVYLSVWMGVAVPSRVDTGKVGDIISAKGENLDKSSIGELYLTDGTHDVKRRSRRNARL